LNWILRAAQGERVEGTSVLFGVIQTALYVDFAWVYYTRQRVKLRNGAVVDSEDFRRGWLVNRIFGKAGFQGGEYDVNADRTQRAAEEGLDDGEDDVPSSRPRRVGSVGGWGKRGISVSADEDLDLPPPADSSSKNNPKAKATQAESADARPDERAGMLEDLGDDLDDDAPETSGDPKDLGNGSEWK
jgi:hypothetical protein